MILFLSDTMKKYFGTDGIRGNAEKLLTQEFLFKVGVAIAKTLKTDYVVIGNDPRESAKRIIEDLSFGIRKEGIDVYYAKDVTTPMLVYYSLKKQVVGIMITASHNLYYDNGIKIFNKGYKLDETTEEKIEFLINNPQASQNKNGSFFSFEDVTTTYLDFIMSLDFKFKDLDFGVDCANGASYKIAPLIFKHYFTKFKAYNIKPDGKNINKNVGSTNLAFIQQKVIKNKHEIGFAFDGDADRCLIVDKNGNIIDGDLMMYIYANYLKKQQLLSNNHLVLTKMSNPGLLKTLTDEGFSFSLTDVGDKHIFKEMNDNGYILGGEASGHIILNQILPTGDSVLLALYMLKILSEENKTIDQFAKHIELYPFKMINIANIDKNVLMKVEVQEAIAEAKKSFKKDYLILIRASGTEPLIRVTMSYKDENILDEQINKMIKIIKEGA